MLRQIVLAATLALTINIVHAEEPLTVFGVPLGMPLSVTECPWHEEIDILDRKAKRRVYNNDIVSTTGGLCYTNGYSRAGRPIIDGDEVVILFPVTDQPSLSRAGQLVVRVVNGKAERMAIYTRGIATQSFDLETLTKKFGPTATLSHPTVQNKLGAYFETIQATWNLPGNVSVSFESVYMQTDQGRLVITTPIGIMAEERAEERRRALISGGRQL